MAAGWGAIAVVALGAVIAWRRARLGPRLSLAIAALASSGFLLGPSAVAVATLGAMACRYAYLSTFAFALAAVVAGRALATRGGLVRRGVIAIACAWAALLVFVTYREIPAWSSNEALYAHAVAVEPGSAMALYRVGVLRVSAGRWEEAAALFESAAQIDPTNDRALDNLAVCDMNLARFDEAEAILHRVLALTHEMSFRAWYNLATVQHLRGATADACASLQRALAINPQYAKARDDYARSCR